MVYVTACAVCGTQFESIQRKVCCSPECKRERKREYDKLRYVEKREEIIARACAWQRENKVRKQAYDAEYRDRTAERRLALKREYTRVYIKENREQYREYAARRRARKHANGAFIVTEKDYARALTRQGRRCTYCEVAFGPDVPIHWDHIVPIARGGSHSIGNLAAACAACNQAKSHRTVTEWRAGKIVPYFQ